MEAHVRFSLEPFHLCCRPPLDSRAFLLAPGGKSEKENRQAVASEICCAHLLDLALASSVDGLASAGSPKKLQTADLRTFSNSSTPVARGERNRRPRRIAPPGALPCTIAIKRIGRIWSASNRCW